MMADAGGLMDQRKSIMKMKHLNNKVMRDIKRPNKKKNRSYKKREDSDKVLQQLFDSCRKVFKGPGTVPLDSDVDKLCTILDKMKAKDVGLSKNMQFFKAKSAMKGTPGVAYTTIYQCHEFSLCIFFLPATAVIPLHNHPGMTVFSKVLLGNLHIKSYDWVDSQHPMPIAMPPSSGHLRLARLKVDRVLKTPCETSVLYPTTGGNIHELRAITPCAVLDVLGPPYSKQDHRDCSYYIDLQHSASSNGETSTVIEEGSDHFRWLEEIEMPEDSQMDRIEYLGPQIIETTSFF